MTQAKSLAGTAVRGSRSASRGTGNVAAQNVRVPRRRTVVKGVAGAPRKLASLAHRDIQMGFAFGEVETFQRASLLPLEAIQRILLLPTRTYQRRKSEGRLKAVESDRLWRLERLFGLAVALFEGDSAAATGWFQKRAEGLGRRSPLEMTETEAGAREVEDLIGRLENGVFS